MEKNKKEVLAHYIIGSAIIWAATIIGCALILKKSFNQISLLLTGASAVHFIIFSSLSTQIKKQGEECKLKQGLKDVTD